MKHGLATTMLSASSANASIRQKLLSGKQIFVLFGAALILGGLLLILFTCPTVMAEGIVAGVVSVVDCILAAVDLEDAFDKAVLVLVSILGTGQQRLLAQSACLGVVRLPTERRSEVTSLICNEGHHFLMSTPSAV